MPSHLDDNDDTHASSMSTPRRPPCHIPTLLWRGRRRRDEGMWGQGVRTRGCRADPFCKYTTTSAVLPFFPMSLVYIILCMLYKINCIRMNQYNFVLTSTISVVCCV